MNQNHLKIIQATLLVAISGILYGFLGFLGTGVLRENIPISTMLFWRFLIAAMWIFMFVISKHSTGGILNRIDWHTALVMFILGAVGYAGSSEFYFLASQYTGTGLAMVIFFSYPIIIAFSSWLLHRQKLHVSTVLVLVAMVVGLILLRNSSAYQLNIIGIVFGVFAAISYAIYVMGGKYISTVNADSSLLTMMVCFGCAFIFLVVSIFSGHWVFPYTLKSWSYLLALGIFATALPIQLMLEGLKYISSMRASIISVLEPLVTVFVGIILLDESITHLQMTGAFIILGSALLVQFHKEL